MDLKDVLLNNALNTINSMLNKEELYERLLKADDKITNFLNRLKLLNPSAFYYLKEKFEEVSDE